MIMVMVSEDGDHEGDGDGNDEAQDDHGDYKQASMQRVTSTRPPCLCHSERNSLILISLSPFQGEDVLKFKSVLKRRGWGCVESLLGKSLVFEKLLQVDF